VKAFQDSGHRPASPDALIFKGKIIYCVEFKNSFKESVRVKENLPSALIVIFLRPSYQTQNRAVKAFQRPLIKSDCCRLI
jgi:Holliday junction resolvase